MAEVWKDIPDYKGLYQINNFGEIKSLSKNIGNKYFSKQRINHIFKYKNGYVYVSFCNTINGKKTYKKKKLHRLIAQCFIPNPQNKPDVNHLDGNKENNNIANLEWVTKSENAKHAYRIGLIMAKKGALNILSKKVNQYSLNGEFIRSYGSTREVKRLKNIPQTSIAECCRGKIKKSHGYVWKYELS